ncbi:MULTISPECIES: ORF6C domain-containing protein [Clostridium]|uniref:ORF6C domain-containing protein n=1 Tax=Clostridium TaxID=1485 RepID=UPI0032ECA7CF
MESISHMHKDGVMVGYRNNQLVTIDSREVAEMLGKEHSYVLEMIQGREGKLGIIPVLENANLAVSNYFIQSTYRSGTREYKCYLVTKMGCELLGNKQQGEKGILFTAKYVERFNKMEQAIKGQLKPLTTEEMLELQFKYAKEVKEEVIELKEDFKELKDNLPLLGIDCDEITSLIKKVCTRVTGYGTLAYKDKSLRGRVYADIYGQVKREFQVKSYKAIKRSQAEKAKEIIRDYKAPTGLLDEISRINNQINFKDVV